MVDIEDQGVAHITEVFHAARDLLDLICNEGAL